MQFVPRHLGRLQCFVAVAEELHFGRAADRLVMAQPPLSQQIRRLEEELGLQLLVRTTRSVALTDAGRTVYDAARKVIAAAEALGREVEHLHRGDHGLLRLGFVDSASYEVMPTLLTTYRSRWPGLAFELTSLSSDEQHRALAAGTIDVGISRTTGPAADIRATTFLREPLVIAAPADHRLGSAATLTLLDLAREPLIGFDRRASPTLHAEVTTLFARQGVRYDPVIEATEYTTILGLVASGQGVAVVPASVRTFRPPNLRFVPLDDPDAATSLMLLSRGDDHRPPVERLHAVVEELAQV